MKYELHDRGRSWQAIEHYPPYTLSIIAGPGAHSKPVIKLDSIEQYELVEIAIMCDGEFVSDEFLTQFPFFYDPPTADRVNWDQVNIVRRRLELLSSPEGTF